MPFSVTHPAPVFFSKAAIKRDPGAENVVVVAFAAKVVQKMEGFC